MKKITLLLLGLLFGFTCVQTQKANNIPIDAVHFPDEIFRNYISVQFDLNHDDILSKKEIAKVYAIKHYPNICTTEKTCHDCQDEHI